MGMLVFIPPCALEQNLLGGNDAVFYRKEYLPVIQLCQSTKVNTLNNNNKTTTTTTITTTTTMTTTTYTLLDQSVGYIMPLGLGL